MPCGPRRIVGPDYSLSEQQIRLSDLQCRSQVVRINMSVYFVQRHHHSKAVAFKLTALEDFEKRRTQTDPATENLEINATNGTDL